MIKKELIKRGLFCTIPREIPVIYSEDGRMINLSITNTKDENPLIEVESVKDDYVLCYLYCSDAISNFTQVPISHIEARGIKVNLDESDKYMLRSYMQQYEEECNEARGICRLSPGLRTKIHYFCDKYFREKYGIKREGEKI